eukprot:scaffold12605_cov114-Isochrysis_galbana.AAC.4
MKSNKSTQIHDFTNTSHTTHRDTLRSTIRAPHNAQRADSRHLAPERTSALAAHSGRRKSRPMDVPPSPPNPWRRQGRAPPLPQTTNEGMPPSCTSFTARRRRWQSRGGHPPCTPILPTSPPHPAAAPHTFPTSPRSVP